MNNKDKSKLYTTLAFLLGYILIENLTTDEQNSFGNWLMLVGQMISTNSSYQFNDKEIDEIDITDTFHKFKNSVNRVDDIIKNDRFF